MKIAVAVGIGLASILFIKRTIDLYSIELVNTKLSLHPDISENISIYDINGPMFFGAAQNALKTLLSTKEDIDVVILNMQNVTMIDMTGIVALKSIVDTFENEEKTLIFCGLNERILKKLEKANFQFDNLIAKKLNIERAKLSIGTLGGGNHFIEVGKNSINELFLIIHSGSRNIGGQVAKHYQDIAINNLTDNSKEREQVIERLKIEGKQDEIENELKKIKKIIINNNLAYITGTDFDNYMHDMKIMQEYAVVNRRTIANIILEKTGLTQTEAFETIHNYIDFKRMILRKGAVSAECGEILLIPINMRDGSIIAKGKGNEDWNFSAPHGAGRLMGRKEAHEKLNFNEFKEQMKNVYSTSVLTETLDEAPDAYKSMNEIIQAIEQTVEVIDIIKPIYNFKAH
jgi:RNA-splicing ligase RtcB